MHFQPYIRKIGPKYIRDFFSIRETSYSLRGSGAVNLCVPKFDLNFMRNSFTCKCAQWNKLLEDVKLADDVNIFKSKLRSIQLEFLYFHIYIFVIFIFFYILVYIDLDYIFKFFLIRYYYCRFNARSYFEGPLALLDDNVVKYIILFHPQTQQNRIIVPQIHLLDDIKFF